MMRRIKIHYILICILFSLSLCGCGAGADYAALEQLRVVETLGYDLGPEGVVLSVSAKGDRDSAPPLRLKSAGNSIREALEGLRRSAGDGELFFAHTRFIVVGRAAAEAGAGALLDYIKRDESLRLGAMLLVTEGKAAELIAPEEDSGETDVTEALDSARRDIVLRGGEVTDLRETAVALSEYGAAPVCLIRAGEEADGSRFVAAAGCGVFNREAVLTAALSPCLAEAAGLLRNRPGARSRTVSAGAASMEYEGRAVFRPSWNPDGSPGPFLLRLELRSGIAEGGGALPEDALAEALAEALREDVTALLRKLQELDADILGLGQALRISGGKRFDALPPDWLARLELIPEVRVQVSRGYDTEDRYGEG